jgi:malonate decarboxylase delta subunit
METLHFSFSGGKETRGVPTLVGVLASGNLEVLVEPQASRGACEVHIFTAAVGFGSIWSAVLTEFFHRRRTGDISITINDAGATPATVSLRLDQAVDAFIASK